VSRAAFLKAERARRRHKSVSPEQRRHLKRLSLKAGIEMPKVYSRAQATDAITRLEEMRRQPTLGPMG
jgi:hypothetical protein